MNSYYLCAKEIYAANGVDTEAAIEKLASVPVSLHCWQGDDVIGTRSATASSARP